MKKTRIIKFCATLLCILCLCPLLSFYTFAESEDISGFDFSDKAKAVYLYSYDADRVVFCQGEQNLLSPGPTAKIMTGLIACEAFANNLDKQILITEEMVEGVSGNSMNLREGMRVSVRDLIYGTICGCNNDAAQALAIVCEGTLASFVKRMNEYASSLYMKSTRYANPTGLNSASAKTTVYDAALLADHAAKNQLYMQISTASSYKFLLDGKDSVTMYNRNALVSQFSEQGYINKDAQGIIAGKDDSGFLVCATAEKKDMKYLCVVMGAETDADEIYSYYIANALFDYAFSNYTIKKIASKGDKLTTLTVNFAIEQGKDASVVCVLPEDIYAFLPKDADVASELKYKLYFHEEQLCAPLPQNTVVGGVDIYHDGIMVATSKLITRDDVEANSILLFLNTSKSFLTGRFFIIFICTSVVLLSFYIFFIMKHSRRKKVIRYSRFR